MVKLIEVENKRVTKLFIELREEIREYETQRGFKILEPQAIVYNSIGTYKSTRSMGNCYRNRIGGDVISFKISVNELLALNGTDKDIKDILMHELVHTVKGCFNHSNRFKNKALNMKYYLGYDGLRKEFENKYTSDKAPRNIIYKCTNCGREFKRRRHFDTLVYRCAKCKGRIELVLDK